MKLLVTKFTRNIYSSVYGAPGLPQSPVLGPAMVQAMNTIINPTAGSTTIRGLLLAANFPNVLMGNAAGNACGIYVVDSKGLVPFSVKQVSHRVLMRHDLVFGGPGQRTALINSAMFTNPIDPNGLNVRTNGGFSTSTPPLIRCSPLEQNDSINPNGTSNIIDGYVKNIAPAGSAIMGTVQETVGINLPNFDFFNAVPNYKLPSKLTQVIPAGLLGSTSSNDFSIYSQFLIEFDTDDLIQKENSVYVVSSQQVADISYFETIDGGSIHNTSAEMSNFGGASDFIAVKVKFASNFGAFASNTKLVNVVDAQSGGPYPQTTVIDTLGLSTNQAFLSYCPFFG